MLQVEGHGVVRVLVGNLDEAVKGEVLRDLEALLSEGEVEALRALEEGAIDLQLLGEGVVTDAPPLGLVAEHGEEFAGFEPGGLGEGWGVGLLRVWCC